MTVPSFLINQATIAKGVKKVEKMFPGEVEFIRHNIGETWVGDPGLFFRVVLSNKAAEVRGRLITSKIEEAVDTHIDPLGKWGLFPYFNYRSKSEYDQMKDPDWE